MNFGTGRGEQRQKLLEERDDRIAEFMRQKRSVASIAKLEGLEELYARKAINRIAAERGIEYDPDKEVPGGLLTDQSREYRSRLANMIYDYRSKNHPIQVARDIGLTQAQQLHATERGGRHDASISTIERLAAARGENFTVTQLKLLLTKEQFQIVAKCLNI